MIKRPQKDETLEDILKQHEEFIQQKQKNPNLKLAASVVQTESAKNARKSIFARSRVQESTNAPPVQAANQFNNNEISENILGIHRQSKQQINDNAAHRPAIVLGDVCERSYANVLPKPAVISTTPRNKSIFVKNLEAEKEMQRKSKNAMEEELGEQEKLESDSSPVFKKHLKRVYGETSIIVADAAASKEIHDMNVTTLSSLPEKDILEKRNQLLKEMDSDLVQFLIKRRQQQQQQQQQLPEQQQQVESDTEKCTVNKLAKHDESMNIDVEVPALQENNPAWELLNRSKKEKWLNFDVVEPHKLHWLHDLPDKPNAKLKPGEQYEARFDWKGVLLPYSFEEGENVKNNIVKQQQQQCVGNNELFLHGDEEHRPGYTIQELFRLARSNIQQQRVAAFEALAGILSIYQQGFYDGVLELPIAKIFFLLRYGFDENSISMLQATSKALSALFYNECDETLLDHYYDNPHYHRQPSLPVSENIYMGKPIQDDDDNEDAGFEALENLQKQMAKLNMQPKHMQYSINAKQPEKQQQQQLEEKGADDEEDNKMSMSDFELAEKDLIDCLMRTNILQRIWYILNIPQQENDIVASCLKILIRMARTSSEIAAEIIKNQQLINCLKIYATLEASTNNSNNSQVLCLKLIRVLFTHGDLVAYKLMDIFQLESILDKYLLTFDWRQLKESTLRAQIEILRILRQIIAHQVDPTIINRKYGNGLRYILEWHYKNTEINVDAPYLLRQHAAAILSLINMNIFINKIECDDSQLVKLINDCSCKWFYRASKQAIKEFSQSTLLTLCLEAIKLCIGLNENLCDCNRFITEYLPVFLSSQSYFELCKTCINNSILLNAHNDRRHVHKPLPNVGAVIQHVNGPQLIVGQNYPMHLLNALLTFMEIPYIKFKNHLYMALMSNNQIIKCFLAYLENLQNKCFNQFLATNYFAMIELTLIPQLLSMDAIKKALQGQQIYYIAYRVLCSFSHEHTREILKLCKEIIFNEKYLNVHANVLKMWHENYIKLLIYDDNVSECFDVGAAINALAVPLLPMDWPYYHLRVILLNLLNNKQQIMSNTLAEREAIEMTLRFSREIEFCETISATQQLMYLMIIFMGPDAAYQEQQISALIREHLLRFYDKYKTHTFQLNIKYFGMSHFEDLYFMFVDHFQASSYGNELFSSLLMVPLAQKYPDKFRKRVWSDFGGALYCVQCSEDLLIGGLDAYLEPAEEDESLLISYAQALSSTPRPSSLLSKIATHHVQQWKKRAQKSLKSTNQEQQDGQENSCNFQSEIKQN